MIEEQPIVIFILSFNRPLYLWTCLDSIYRTTNYPAKVVIADNASHDPMCRRVIEGFQRRDMFHRVYLCEDNRPDRLHWLIDRHRSEIGEFFGFIESDVEIQPSNEGWLTSMVRHMRENPRLMMLGSHIDKRDFVDPEFARKVSPELSDADLEFLIKAKSPERQPVDASQELISPHNPPGRLLLFRTSIFDVIELSTDGKMHFSILDAGFDSKIATTVVHRHLSLLNFYDYPDYDGQLRDDFFARGNRLADSRRSTQNPAGS